jgi:arylsulfatase A
VFSSDNGTTHLGQEVDYKFFKSVGELRGLKGSLYEGGVRVPGVVRWPKHVAAGSQSDRISGFEDWMPTLLELAGGTADDVPQGIDGISMVPTLLGKQQEERPFLYREFTGYGGQQSVRVGPWKAVRQNLVKRDTFVTELYNLVDDIGETKDVADKQPVVLARLEKLLAQQHVPSEMFPLRAIDGKRNPGKRNPGKRNPGKRNPAKKDSTKENSTKNR